MKITTKGFTLVEVIAAITLFALFIVSFIAIPQKSLFKTKHSKLVFEASILAERIINEKEFEYQKSIDKFGVSSSFKEESGTFDEPYENFQWKATLRENTIKITTEELSKLMLDLGLEEDEVKAQLEGQKLMLSNINKVLKENYAELYIEVLWEFNKEQYSFPLITHLIPSKPSINFTDKIDDTGNE